MAGHLRSIALLLTFLTGIAGLIYEVTWHRYLANLLGSQAEATAIILAVFLGGLSCGYLLFGRWSQSRRARDLVKIYGGAEVAIGIWALLFPLLYGLVWKVGGIASQEQSWHLVVDIALAVLLIGLPTLLMGGTLPLLTQALSRSWQDSVTLHASVYAINTAGAFFGCILAGFVLIPTLGLTTSIYIAAALNILAGGVFIACSRLFSEKDSTEQTGETPEETPTAASSGAPQLAALTAAIIALAAGFHSLGLQAVFVRLVGIVMGSSEYAFCIVVSVFIAMIAIGAWTVRGRDPGPRSLFYNQIAVLAGCLILHLTMNAWPYVGHRVRIMFSFTEDAFYLYHLTMFVGLCLVMALPLGAMGRTMPLLFGIRRRRMRRLGNTVGNLYGWNTFGCVTGALIGGYLLLYVVNLDVLFRICLVAVMLTIALAAPWRQLDNRGQRIAFGFLTVMMASTIFMAVPWNTKHFAQGLFNNRYPLPDSFNGASVLHKALLEHSTLLDYQDGPNTTVAVFRGAPNSDYARELGKTLSIFVNGKPDGATESLDLVTNKMLAHLGGLFDSSTRKRAAVVGFGTGVSAGGLSLYKKYDTIDLIEISPTIKGLAHHFDFVNHRVTKNPKINWHIGDAYRVLGDSQETYGAILSVPSNPWVTGVERLYSQEFYETAYQRLDDRGTYVQWFNGYVASADTLGMVMRTFGSVFPHTRFFSNNLDFFLLGSKTPFDDRVEGLMKRMEAEAVLADLKLIKINSPAEFLATELWFPLDYYYDGIKHTLENPKLAFMAGKDFFMNRAINIETKLMDRKIAPWSRRRADTALLARLIKRNPHRKSALLKLALPNLCKRKVEKFYKGWTDSPRQCYTALAALAVSGDIEPDHHLNKKDLKLLRSLMKNSKSTTELPKEENEAIRLATHAARLFASYDSPFLSLSADKLATLVTPCLDSASIEAVQCRAHLVDSMARSANDDHARRWLEKLKAENNDILSFESIVQLDVAVKQAETSAKIMAQ